ncbi:MAG: DUF4093 domain-containing protein [Clostridia bacterium]|nr:DUF4093 domain-containing protein [Clostridia bacterium]
MIKIKEAIICEGKYDKIRLSGIFDTVIITTDGFRIFKDPEKKALIRLLAERQGLVLLTDSDGAGQMIRKYLEKLVPKDRIKNLYLPEIRGKEKRKTSPSAAGLLGVEGTDNEIIIEAAKRAGILSEITEAPKRKISKTDLFNLGLSGGEGSQEKRKSLLSYLKLSTVLTANSLLDVLNSLYSYDEFVSEVEKWNRGSAQS